MHCVPVFQLKSNPSDKEEKEAQSQLSKSDEIQRLVAQAGTDFDRKDYLTAAAHLDTIIEVTDKPTTRAINHLVTVLSSSDCTVTGVSFRS